MGSSKKSDKSDLNWLQRWAKKKVEKVYDSNDLRLDGSRPEDMQVHNNNFYIYMCLFVSGYDRKLLGECYMDGYYDINDIATHFEKACQYKTLFKPLPLFLSHCLRSVPMLFFNMQTKEKARKDISKHYDIGNDLFKLMLDRSMNYSCGYWQKNVLLNPIGDNSEFEPNTLCSSLDEAQMNKMLLIARKLDLKPGMRVLDIGCGWGYLAKFLALNFGVHVVGVTISTKQIEYANKNDTDLEKLDFLRVPGLKPVPVGSYEFLLKDYREVNETFHRIVSVGMIEHVGKKNYEEFFKIANKYLRDDGLFLLHTIGINNHYLPQVCPWTNTYIFPGGMLPYHHQLIKAMKAKFVIEDWHNLGYDYSRTLDQWSINFKNNWHKIEHDYDERFRRMWSLYLGMASGLFRARKFCLWQLVLSKDGYKGGYVSVR